MTMLGKLLGGRYQVIQDLSAGGFSKTYIAEDTHRPGKPRCVVKHLKPASANPSYLQTVRRLFNSEAETLEKLGNHDRIPRLLAHFEDNQEFYLVQEFITGHPLSDELQPGQLWTERQVVEMLQDVLGILVFVHNYGVIHRDIKPGNLIRRNSDGKLVLIDFGAVKQIQTQMAADFDQMPVTVAVGTPGYMPVEQVSGRPRPSSDIYALGAIALQALTGLYPTQLQEDPNTRELLWQHQAQASPGLASVLNRMVRYDYRERYQSASEALAALEQLFASCPPTQLPNTPPAPIPPTQALPVPPSRQQSTPPVAPKSSKSLLLLGGMAVVVSVGVGIAIAYINSVNAPPISSSESTPNATPSSRNTTANSSFNEFERAQFPQASCGDSLQTGSNSQLQFYPVFIEYSDSNLNTVQSNFCADAYKTTRKDNAELAIQVASFTSRDRAQLFSNFMKNKLGSGDVGQPTIYSANSSTKTTGQKNCSTVVSDPDSPLNVRSLPDATKGNVVDALKDGTPISVISEQNGWLQISSPVQGWVAKNRTKQVCQ